MPHWQCQQDVHRSGIYNFTEDVDYLNLALFPGGDLERAWSPEEIVAVATYHEMVFSPGARYAYSNTNYILLGMIIETATGRRLIDVIRTRLLRPHELSDTYLEGA
jgi:D-alanyl-D-alanine carboxypeptidase